MITTKARSYAQAFFEKAVSSPGDIARYAKNLEKTLAAEGKKELLREITKELSKLVAAEERKRTVAITVAKESDMHSAKKHLSELQDSLGGKEHPRIVEKVDRSLIGGYRIEAYGKRADRSYKRQLLDLYSRITS